MTYDETLKCLMSRPKFRKQASFSSLRHFMSKLHIEDQFPLVHLVGTNGKGSVGRMVSQTAIEAGLKVGSFISPHLIDVRERITLNHQMISKEDFTSYGNAIEKIMAEEDIRGEEAPLFFEYLLLIALLYFRDQAVDLVILEAGIGGKYDSTNVLNHRLCNVITAVDYDHTEILGDTLEAIALDKGDIIRPGIPTVYDHKHEEVGEVMIKLCQSRQSELYQISSKAPRINARSKEGIDFSLENKYYYYEGLFMPSTALYQLENAAVAAMAVHILTDYFPTLNQHFPKGLRDFSWPGRMEYLQDDLLVDGGHNIAAIKEVVAHLNTVEKERPIDLVFAVMSDKAYPLMIEEILKIQQLKHIWLADIEIERSVQAETLKMLIENQSTVTVSACHSLNALVRARKQHVGARTLLVCLGSLYLVGAIKNIEEDLA